MDRKHQDPDRCHNSPLSNALYITAIYSITMPPRGRRWNHRDVAEAIGARDADRARRCMENLLADAKLRLDEAKVASKDALA